MQRVGERRCEPDAITSPKNTFGSPQRSNIANQPLFELRSLYAQRCPRRSANERAPEPERTTTSAK